jgi:hypothetical protein
MVLTVHCLGGTHERWPARNGKPGGEAFRLVVEDVTKPFAHSLRKRVSYSLTEEEREKYWGKCEDRTLQIAVTDIAVFDGAPVLRGEILSLDGNSKGVAK